MASHSVLTFLEQIAEDGDLRTEAQKAYRSGGLDSLVHLADQHGHKVSADDIESVISPAQLGADAEGGGTSIGWGG